jgi:hypothetical protein
MTHTFDEPFASDRSTASLRAALEELAALPVDVTTARTIAIAVGILMERFEIAPEEGLDLVVAVSRQLGDVEIGDVACELAVGAVFEGPWRAPALKVAATG